MGRRDRGTGAQRSSSAAATVIAWSRANADDAAATSTKDGRGFLNRSRRRLGWSEVSSAGVASKLAAVLVVMIGLVARVALGANTFARQAPVGDIGFSGLAGPPGRSGHATVVTDDSKMFVFGGRAAASNGDYLNDLWLYDWDTGSWVAYVANELLCDQCSECGEVGSCYDWTGLRPYTEPKLMVGKNRKERAVPSGRVHHAMSLVLNRETGIRDTVVLFGGESIDCTDYCDDTWHYNIDNNVWNKKAEADYTRERPVRRWKHAMTDYYDAVFMFGGHSQRLLATSSINITTANSFYYDNDAEYDSTRPLFMDDLWVYNATEREWDYLAPLCTTCDPNATEADGTAARDVNGPRGRISPSLVSYGDALYLFGGYAYGGESNFVELYPVGETNQYPSLQSKYFLDDLWKYDIVRNEWTELNPIEGYSARPPPRYGHSAAVVIKGSDVIMLVQGGNTWQDEIGDMWQYNISSGVWTEVGGEGQFPSRRYGATMVAVGQASSLRTGTSRQAGRALIFGGHGCLKGKLYTEAANAAASESTQVRTFVDTDGVTYTYSVSTSGELQYKTATSEYQVAQVGDPMLLKLEAALSEALYGETICTEELDDLWQYLPDECPNDCSRAGTCSFNVCKCISGFYGVDCSQPECPGSNCTFDPIGRETICEHCSGRGECVDGTCTNCAYPSSGLSCENKAGLCTTCTCYEDVGETPPEDLDCNIIIDTDCVSNPSVPTSAECAGNGFCVEGACICYPGFTDSMLITRVGDARIPAKYAPNGTVIPAPECGYDADSETKWNADLVTDACEPVYIADCGGFLYQLAGSRRRDLFAVFVLIALTFEIVLRT